MAITLADAFGVLKGRRKAIDDAVNDAPQPQAAPVETQAPVSAPRAPQSDAEARAAAQYDAMKAKYGLKCGGMVGKAGKRIC